ncbi:hypothetical protein EMCRGX_G015917 [Ephydatia muelleri]
MIGDRIVVGIRDETMSKRLQLDPDLTLEKAKRIVRQQEAVQEQQKVLKGMEDVTLDEASGSKRHVKGQPDSFPKRQQGKKCSRCGTEQHPFSECPARKATCYRCYRKGHFSNCCLSKELEDVSPQQSDLSPVFLDTLSRVIGQFSGKVSHNGRESIETILVVAGLWTNLLGLPAIMALKLVARLEAVTVALVVDTFLALFEGLGNLGEPFEIRLQPGARPYALFTPRNIPIPLRQRVRQELDRMLLLGVISKVDIPSPWCAGMVVVPKKNGDIRISVDFRPLKSSVLSRILEGIEGVVCQIDDILVFGKDQDQHDTRLMAVLKRVQSAGVTLNKDKCNFSKSQVQFLGHVIDQTGIRADPVLAIQNIEPPKTIPELQRFLGMPTVLCIYDPNAETMISGDASSRGLGAVLLQKHDSVWKPVAYASRSLSDTEANYAQIEKEALACVWACEKFSTYVLDQLKPKWPYLKEFQMQDDRVKKNSKMNFDREHKAQSLPQIPDDASVWITNERHQPAPGRVVEQDATPRSYIVDNY